MNDKPTYIESRLAEYGLTPTAPINSFEWQDLDLDGKKQTCAYFQQHDDGIEIHSPTVYGERPSHLIRKKKVYISRLRMQYPAKDENGEETKYKFTSTFRKDHAQDLKGSWLFIPPRIYEKITKKEKVRTLWITEGEFKSFIPSMWGLDIVGIPGISNFRESSRGKLLEGLRYIIHNCRVENVVVFYDSDCLDLSSKLGKNQKGADARPRQFYRSAEQIRRLLVQENVNVFLGYIKPQPTGKLGLDDLFLTKDQESKKAFDKRCKEIIEKLQACLDKVSTRQHLDDDQFALFDITEQNGYDPETKKSYRILSRIFKLETVNRFYDYHKTRQLKGFEEFRFNRLLYNIVDGTPVMHDDQTKLRNPVKRIGNAYFVDDSDGFPVQYSDFAIDLHYIIYVNADDTRRIATFTNTHNETYFTELRKETLTSVMEFKKKLNSWQRFNFFGSSKHLDYVKALIEYDNDVIMAKMITCLGWQEDEKIWAFSNGIVKSGEFLSINQHGISSVDGKGFCLPAFSKITSFSEQYKEDRWFSYYETHEEKQMSFSEYREKMTQYFAAEDNGMIGILYLIMSLFSDVVFDSLKFVPLLYLTGIHQSGKNTMARSIMAPFGRYKQPPNIHFITATAANRICSHYSNSIVWLDEWKNEIPKWKQEYVKSAFDRTGRTIAKFTNDDAVKRVEYKSCMMISGQDIPGQGATDSAITSRGIICFFRTAKFSQEEKERVKQFEEFQDKYGLTNIIGDIIRHRKLIEEHLSTKFSDLQGKLSSLLIERKTEVSGRIMDIHVALITPSLILQEAGHIDLAKTEEELIELMYQKATAHHELNESQNEVSGFWEIFETLYYLQDERNNDNLRDGYEFRIKEDEIAIRVSRVYDRYARYARKNNKTFLDKNTLGEYLKNHPAYKGVKSARFKDGSVDKPLIFDRGLLNEAVNILTEEELEARKAYSEQDLQEGQEEARPEIYQQTTPPLKEEKVPF